MHSSLQRYKINNSFCYPPPPLPISISQSDHDLTSFKHKLYTPFTIQSVLQAAQTDQKHHQDDCAPDAVRLGTLGELHHEKDPPILLQRADSREHFTGSPITRGGENH